jgi:hypothetical protein
MSDPLGSTRIQVGVLPGMSAAELAALAAHATNNIESLLLAAMVFLEDAAGRSQSVRGNAILATGMARLHTLSSALGLLALQPAPVALMLTHQPHVLGAHTLDRLREELAREPQLQLVSCPPLDDLPSRIDRGTLQSLLVCMIECVRRRLPETLSARLSWSCSRDVPPRDGALPGATCWVFAVDFDADPATVLFQTHEGMADRALAHAAVLLQPLGIQIEAGLGGRCRLLLAAPPASAEDLA